MKMLMPHSKQQGFSLMEVMIGALLLAVALLGLARLQVIILANSGSSRIRANALAAAQDKMEELRSFSTHNAYSSLTGGTDTPSTAYANLTRTWSVTNCTPTPCKYRNVSVTVSWTDADNTAQQVQLTSEIAEADPVQAGVAVALLAESATTPAPTEAPTPAPTEAPTSAPTEAPTSAPTEAPTSAPTEAPTSAPTEAPTSAPNPNELVLTVVNGNTSTAKVSWTVTSGATYQVYKCTNTNSTAKCTPGGTGTTTTSPYNVSFSNKDTICFYIKTSSGSVQSTTLCSYRSASSYTFPIP